jgi:hypothetical protein
VPVGGGVGECGVVVIGGGGGESDRRNCGGGGTGGDSGFGVELAEAVCCAESAHHSTVHGAKKRAEDSFAQERASERKCRRVGGIARECTPPVDAPPVGGPFARICDHTSSSAQAGARAEHRAQSAREKEGGRHVRKTVTAVTGVRHMSGQPRAHTYQAAGLRPRPPPDCSRSFACVVRAKRCAHATANCVRRWAHAGTVRNRRCALLCALLRCAFLLSTNAHHSKSASLIARAPK